MLLHPSIYITSNMMKTTSNQISVASSPESRKTSFGSDLDKAGLDDSNHSLTKKTKRTSLPSTQPTAAIPFPWKLHRILDDADAKGFNDIISWVPSENGFKVHKTKQFDEEIMPKYFDKTKYKSFQRQLNMWGFDRVGQGPYKGAYLHDCFIRGQPKLCENMQRTKIKGIHSKKLRKSLLQNDLLGSSSHHSLGGSSHHSLRGSTHSLGGLSRHSSSSHDVRASIRASAQKLADLERQKEEIQRKLELVSGKANAVAVTDALNNMTGSSTSTMVTPQGSLHSRSERDTLDDFQPLPLHDGDSLLFGGRNFFYAGDEGDSNQRRRPARRFSLELKSENSDEYVLKELPDFFDEDADSLLAPTPLPPNGNVINATSDVNGSQNSSLVIGLDRPFRRFSLLGTPVQDPFNKQQQSSYQKPPRQSMSMSKMNAMNQMKMNMNMMKMNMMNMNINNNQRSSSFGNTNMRMMC